MLKITMCIRRLPHLTREEFDAYWRDRHGPLVRSYKDVLRIKRYVQTSPIADSAAQEALRASHGTSASRFDGCAELWWESLDDLAAVRHSPQGREALRELLADEKKFIDLARSELWYGTERTVIAE